jgi:tagaturonate reductase
VDRIVPGKPSREEMAKLEASLGYTDELLTMSEVFRLWAIEGDDHVKQVLSFSRVDEGVVIAPDITLFKELKLRLLNGTHTFNCGLAFLSGFDITRQAVTDKTFGAFARELMHEEIAPAIPFDIDAEVKRNFANAVFERFCNPYIDHQWLSITVQYTSKMKMRNVPLLLRHYEQRNNVPLHMATGFAAYLLFMRPASIEGGKYFGARDGKAYEIKDDSAAYFHKVWDSSDAMEIVDIVLADEKLWEADLLALPGFAVAVKEKLASMLEVGVFATVAALEKQTVH